MEKRFATWKGIPREEIDWHPTVDDARCAGCGMCVTSCGREVYGYDEKRRKALVAAPLHCMPGCTSCRVWCVYDAIGFPDPSVIKKLIRERNVLAIARRELGKEPGKG